MEKIKQPSIYILSYVLIILFSILWVELNHLPWWVVLIAGIPVIIADIFSHYNVKMMAYLYTHRKRLVTVVVIACIILSVVFYIKFPLHNIYSDAGFQAQFILATQFFLQGGIVGMTLRMLLLNLFADMLRAKDIHKAKLLIAGAWIVFLIMFPVNERHRSLSSIFILGFGIGFMFHYLFRTREKEDAQRKRLKENLLAMIATIQKDDLKEKNELKQVKLTPTEEKAIELYSNQKWSDLDTLLDTHIETITLFFIKLSMLRKLHKYEEAIILLTEHLEDDKTSSHQHYYHLHYALNESERFDTKGEWLHKDKIFSHLELAYQINNDCLLTCATFALRIAGELKTGDGKKIERDRALHFIIRAMKIYEEKPMREIVGLVTGMTVPVTYTFLLDTYAYVLLKGGKTRFSKAMILQSLFQDPSFSATYLHLAEWYWEFYGSDKQSRKYSDGNWRKAAQLNLQIAIEMERENGGNKKGTLISVKAKSLLEKL